jgi:hypothetical protein
VVVVVVSGRVVVVVVLDVVVVVLVVVVVVLVVVVVGPGVTLKMAVTLEAFGPQGRVSSLSSQAVTSRSPALAPAGTVKDACRTPSPLVTASTTLVVSK